MTAKTATDPADAYRASFDMLRADYLAAVGAERFPAADTGGACTHLPTHVVRVADPRPGAEGMVRVLLDCPTRPQHPSIDAHGVTR